jgi:predicted phage terminase large subunit-like protein
MVAGLRPVLIIVAPPQHGKSFSITDFMSWYLGRRPDHRIVYASYSDRLGIRANRTIQRIIDTPKYSKIFPDVHIGTSNVVTQIGKLLRNNDIVETDREGYFRNTTVNGPINGEGLDLGVIDDAIKGRKESNSKIVRKTVWDWLTDDLMSRFSEYAGLLMINTRWHVDDPAGRMIDKLGHKVKVAHYPAINKDGEPLFPEHKSLDFLNERRGSMLPANWESVYQGNPVVAGGNIVDSSWWLIGHTRPTMMYRFITADTAQKKNTWNDYTVFQCWGVCYAGKMHLIDMFRDRVSAPELRKFAVEFYDRHNTASGAPMRGMYIEDKSSGTGLIQEMEMLGKKVVAIPRTTDKVERSMNVAPEIKSGKVILYEDILDSKTGQTAASIIIEEASAHPNGINDDAFDCTMSAVEMTYFTGQIINYSSLV